ncbi:hypothetical protein MSAN_01648400 [Mycena sanguinolenta]|uniref:Uncharacterized protein n=1 Tax=Mycena sanguinolenta TaxID=230812 RepID=A0A8H7CXD4_9AGAR|nr:hypothetical protein MSAN_01648400 [Mycena sanguinolenta]
MDIADSRSIPNIRDSCALGVDVVRKFVQSGWTPRDIRTLVPGRWSSSTSPFLEPLKSSDNRKSVIGLQASDVCLELTAAKITVAVNRTEVMTVHGGSTPTVTMKIFSKFYIFRGVASLISWGNWIEALASSNKLTRAPQLTGICSQLGIRI